MTTRLKVFSILTGVLLVAITLATTVAGQGQQPPAPGGAARGRGEPPAPPAAQAGHPQGKLVIWGDLASFDNPPTLPTHCILTNRFKRGQRVGYRSLVNGASRFHDEQRIFIGEKLRDLRPLKPT